MPNNIYNDLSDKELKAGYWYISHRLLLRRLGFTLLTAVALGLLVFGSFGLIKYFFVDKPQSQIQLARLTEGNLNLQVVSEVNQPQDLQLLQTVVLKSDDKAVDFVTEVNNPNVQWAVESFDYYYLVGEEKTLVQRDFILPQQLKYVASFNFPLEQLLTPEIVIENVVWKKVYDYPSLQEKMLQFEFLNQKINLGKASVGQSAVTNVSFGVVNRSSYNYWEPVFWTLFRRGDELVAINKVVIAGLDSGEIKTQDFNIFQSLSSVVKMEIIADINILNPAVFRGFGRDSGTLK